jgi:hypothetical protein
MVKIVVFPSIIKSYASDNVFFRCPIDNTLTNEVFEDTAVKREVLSLNVNCNNEICSWNGELRELQVFIKIIRLNF